MDVNKLRTLVFEKTGIRIDTGDPIFALVALNEAVLAECIEQHIDTLRQAADTLRDQTVQLTAAGERYRRVLQEIAAPEQSGNTPLLAVALEKASATSSNTSEKAADRAMPTTVQWIAAAVGIAALSAALTLAGGWAFRKAPPALPAPVKLTEPTAPKLTQEQAAMIENGEKFAKMWPKLDPPTQARIKKILQQP